MESAINLFDLEAAAREALDRMAYDYYASGANDELTLRANHRAYEKLSLAYRVLVDVSRRDPATTLLGEPVAMPIAVAPTAFHGLAHPEAERATARAAGEAGTVMILSTLSNSPVEEVVAASRGPVWFQLYVYKDRGATEALLERVQDAGCRAIVLTVDAPVLGRRERDVRNRFRLPPGLAVSNLSAAGYGEVAASADDSGLAAYVADLHDPSLSWEDLDWLRSVTDLPLLIKGIVRPDDALRAARAGVAGIVVSNHGGRQLDTAPAPIEVLPEIVDGVATDHPEVEVLIDGGVRRGTDVLKAIALGARAVLVGRPVLWGLATGGSPGVAAVLALLRQELDVAMALCGCREVAEITRDLIWQPTSHQLGDRP
ncbi:MAG: alpha-hydroxy acid oxidase [Acidobacteriota bacterium]